MAKLAAQIWCLWLILFLSLSSASGQTWTTTGNMTGARRSGTATLLPNGQVLFTGGISNDEHVILDTAELYDPSTRTFSPTAGRMRIARAVHTATLLPDGRVLIVGGESNDPIGSLASAELYDPSTGTFTLTGSMATTRAQHTAVSLSNGKVLVLGGEDRAHVALASAELYDPLSGTFSPTGSMTTPRRIFPRATVLPDGRVLVTGGELFNNGPILDSAELYDPATGTFAPTGGMAVPRVGHSATMLPDGRVLVAGGGGGGSVVHASAELYDPAMGTFSPTGSMTSARGGHGATLLANGQVLLAGGTDGLTVLASAELYDPSAGTFTPTASMNHARNDHRLELVLLGDGTVLVAGGAAGQGPSAPLSSAEFYRPGPLAVSIDIKPGSFPNSINLSSAGVVPVAILSSATFDATQVNPASVTLAGARVKLIGKGDRYSCSPEDVNGDGRLDLVCHVATAQSMIEPGDSIAVLEAETFSGQRIRGEDSIQIVPD